MFSYENLKSIRLEHGYTQTQVAKELGVTRSAYSSWETGLYVPNRKNLKQLAEFYQVSEEYFQSEFEIVHKYLRLNKNNQSILRTYADTLYKTQLVPYRVHAQLSAGTGEFYDEDYQFDTVYFDKTYTYDIASWVKGDSMEPSYHDGDVVLISAKGFDYNGLIYALVYNGETYIKKVVIDEDRVYLHSLNKKYKPIEAAIEDVRIVGQVTHTFRPIEVE